MVIFEGKSIKHLSVLPLHLFLGLVKQAVDIIESICHRNDHILRLHKGEVETKLQKLYNQLEEISEYVEDIDLIIVQIEESIDEVEHEISKLQDDFLDCFSKKGKILLTSCKNIP